MGQQKKRSVGKIVSRRMPHANSYAPVVIPLLIPYSILLHLGDLAELRLAELRLAELRIPTRLKEMAHHSLPSLHQDPPSMITHHSNLTFVWDWG